MGGNSDVISQKLLSEAQYPHGSNQCYWRLAGVNVMARQRPESMPRETIVCGCEDRKCCELYVDTVVGGSGVRDVIPYSKDLVHARTIALFGPS